MSRYDSDDSDGKERRPAVIRVNGRFEEVDIDLIEGYDDEHPGRSLFDQFRGGRRYPALG